MVFVVPFVNCFPASVVLVVVTLYAYITFF
jgi:hypothetical protein